MKIPVPAGWTDQQAADEFHYRVAEREGLLCPNGDVTPEATRIATEEAAKAMVFIANQTKR